MQVLDDLKRSVASALAAIQSGLGQVNAWFGPPNAKQRIVLYALLTALTITFFFRFAPASVGFLRWLQAWLLLALLAVGPIYHGVTGFRPLAGTAGAFLGDILSLRRRILICSLTLAVGYAVYILALTFLAPADMPFFQALATAAGTISLTFATSLFLLLFYLMGFACYWRPISDVASSLFHDRMAGDVSRAAQEIQGHLVARGIRNLELTSLDMKHLRQLTGGDVDARVGQQLVFTRGRARIVVFVQDFGDSMFIRWAGFHDASGRRLWVLVGQVLQVVNQFIFRWTGTNPTRALRDAQHALSPASNRANATRALQGGRLSRLLGLPEGLSEYSWNDLYALDAAIQETVVSVTKRAGAAHDEKEAMRAMISRNIVAERNALARAGQHP